MVTCHLPLLAQICNAHLQLSTSDFPLKQFKYLENYPTKMGK